MSNKKYLKNLLQAKAVSGFEGNAAEIVQKKFYDTFGNAQTDEFFNVTSIYGKGSPVIYMSAHIDEVGLMVHTVEDDGFLGFCSVGGVDPRVLMAQEVNITTESGEVIYGIIGAKPPHVLSPDDVKKAPKMDDLFIDTGLKAEDVKSKVSVGDMVTFIAPPIEILNKKMASKSLDDRMGTLVLMQAYKYIKKRDFKGKAVFCASTQEEIGSRGAKVSAFRENPDIAIAIDVTHGKTPDSKDNESFEMDKVCIALTPYCDRKIVEMFKKASENCGVEIELDVAGKWTGTDGDELQIVREGVSMGVIAVPLKYMHTTVETLSLKTIKKAGKLLGEFLIIAGGAE